MDYPRLLFPAIRWDAESGFGAAMPAAERALELGVGGFIVFGGEARAVRRLTSELRRIAGRPLLIGADLERGAGQQFAGATALPPLAALGDLDDADVVRRAGELTGREARALGVNWVYAPMADIDLEAANPIVGTRAFGPQAARVARLVAAWIEGCRPTGALTCAKHFPGHGRTTADSHLELPAVDAARDELEVDIGPFVAAITADVDSIMTAHVAYPALDPERRPATMSPPIVTDLLRDRLTYDGLVVTDALVMEGAHAGGDEADAAVLALAAGCDALLYPDDVEAVVERIGRAVADGELERGRVSGALDRVRRATERATGIDASAEPGWGAPEDVRWARDTAVRTLRTISGTPPKLTGAVEIVTIDDDLGGPYAPPARTAFGTALEQAGMRVGSSGGSPSDALTALAAAGRTDGRVGDATLVLALYSDIRAWKGRPGLSDEARQAVARGLELGAELVVLFGHPRLAERLPGSASVIAAWGGEAIMQYAAADFLTGAVGGGR